MNHIPTISVAIPAYNEENNIGHIISQLLAQKQTGYILNDITVYSDASTDKTEEIVRQIQKTNPTVKLVRGKKRIGKIMLLNTMFRQSKTDYLMIIDADIYVLNNHFIVDAIHPFFNDPLAQMVNVHTIPARPPTFIGKIIQTDFELWDRVRLSVPNFDTVHAIYGQVTVYASDFLKKLHIPKEVLGDERGYLFLMAKKVNGLRFSFDNPGYYFAPVTLADYIRMHKRPFGENLDVLVKMFGDDIHTFYTIPFRYKVRGIVSEFMHRPFYCSLAIMLNVTMKMGRPLLASYTTGLWEMLSSTKNLYGSTFLKPSVVISNYDDVSNPFYGGGGAVAIHETAKRLVRWFSVTVVTASYPGSKDEIIDGVTYKRVKLPSANPKFGQLLFSLLLLFEARKMKYDLWIENFTPPFSISLLPFFVKSPLVGLVHMLSGEDMKRKYFFPFDLIERFGLPFYKHFITPSLEAAKTIKSIHPKADIQTIPNGVNPLGVIHRKTIHPMILFVGRIEMDQKGLDLLIKSFDKLPQKDAELVLAGSGMDSEVQALSQLVRNAKRTRDIRIMGRINEKQKKELFAQAACFVAPSRFETFSMSALEALANGVPLVTFAIPGLRWIPRTCRAVAQSLTPKSLAAAMNKTISHSDYRNTLIKYGYAFSKNFNWDEIADHYIAYIETLI